MPTIPKRTLEDLLSGAYRLYDRRDARWEAEFNLLDRRLRPDLTRYATRLARRSGAPSEPSPHPSIRGALEYAGACLAHETLIRVFATFENRPRRWQAGDCLVWPWARSILRHAWIDDIRRDSRYRRRLKDFGMSAQSRGELVEEAGPQDPRWTASQALDLLQSPLLRDVFRMVVLERQPQRSVAKALKVSEPTVCRLKVRATRALLRGLIERMTWEFTLDEMRVAQEMYPSNPSRKVDFEKVAERLGMPVEQVQSLRRKIEARLIDCVRQILAD